MCIRDRSRMVSIRPKDLHPYWAAVPILYAISRSVITKGDNGRWQPDYSGIGGALVSGAISNLYYPEGSRHGFTTTLTNTLIGIGTGAGVNILQEFVFPKITPKLPKHSASTS